jgi:hypothetical protein
MAEILGQEAPDGMVIDKKEKVCYVLEFKRALGRYGGPVHGNKRDIERNYIMKT